MHTPSSTPVLSAEQARALLRYEPETGKLFWRERPVEAFAASRVAASWNLRCAGKETFTDFDSSGYLQGQVLGRSYKAHRVAWLLQTGQWPKDQVDHVNGRRDDNRRENLREATHSQNQRNQKRSKNNTSGVTGVYWHKTNRKWQAMACGEHLGSFDTKEEAIAARVKAHERYGFSKRHGDQVLDLC